MSGSIGGAKMYIAGNGQSERFYERICFVYLDGVVTDFRISGIDIAYYYHAYRSNNRYPCCMISNLFHFFCTEPLYVVIYEFE
jgi:hypothetical protein